MKFMHCSLMVPATCALFVPFGTFAVANRVMPYMLGLDVGAEAVQAQRPYMVQSSSYFDIEVANRELDRARNHIVQLESALAQAHIAEKMARDELKIFREQHDRTMAQIRSRTMAHIREKTREIQQKLGRTAKNCDKMQEHIRTLRQKNQMLEEENSKLRAGGGKMFPQLFKKHATADSIPVENRGLVRKHVKQLEQQIQQSQQENARLQRDLNKLKLQRSGGQPKILRKPHLRLPPARRGHRDRKL